METDIKDMSQKLEYIYKRQCKGEKVKLEISAELTRKRNSRNRKQQQKQKSNYQTQGNFPELQVSVMI